MFDHSPVFRVGGDEFAVILMNNDFTSRDELISLLEKRQEERNGVVRNKWEKVSIAYGIAVYDPELDSSVSDTARRADKVMYDNKRKMKKK